MFWPLTIYIRKNVQQIFRQVFQVSFIRQIENRFFFSLSLLFFSSFFIIIIVIIPNPSLA
jgi:hypothetical protein